MMRISFLQLLLSISCLSFNSIAQKPRARDIGIPFEGMPGKGLRIN